MQNQDDTVYLYTDGACSGNPGPGGYCAILKYGEFEKIVSGGSAQTTNNRMELSAVIEGLRALNRPCSVLLTTDSKYVADAITKRWLQSWKKNNWVKSDKKPVLNRELWEDLDTLLQKHKVDIQWVKGHAGHPENERCDEVAVMEANKYK